MKLEDIMKLIDAGYTKEEIAEFKDLQTQEPKQEDDKTDPEQKEDETEPVPHYVDQITKLTEQVKTLTEAMQKNFLESAEKKTGSNESGEDVLKNIIEKGVI